MATLYDEDGNLIEGALTPDEVKAIQEEKEAIAKEAADAKERLSKLEAKDMNFRRLEQMTEEEREKLSAKETELLKRIESVEDREKEFTQKQIDSIKQHTLSGFTDDDELKEKVLRNYDRIKDEATSADEIAMKMREAYSMTVGTENVANPLSVAMGYAGGQGPKSEAKKNFAETPAGKEFAKSLGLRTE